MNISNGLQILAAYRKSYIDRYTADCASATAFDDLRQHLSVATTVPYPRAVISILPSVSFVIGVVSFVLTAPSGFDTLVGVGFVSSQYLIVVGGFYWGDRRYWPMVSQISTAFDDSAAFYRYVGRITQRIYDMNPFITGAVQHPVHYPTLVLTLVTWLVGFIVFFPTLPFPFNLVPYTPLWWYFLVNALLLSYLTVLIVWAGLVGLFYLGYHISEHSELRIRIDVTQRINRLGLKPFGVFLTKITLLSLANLILLTGFVLLTDPTHLFALLLPIQSVNVIVPFFAFQYGLHKLIIQSKREQMQYLKSQHEEQLTQWFDGPITDDRRPTEIESVLVIKQEIDDLPEWPTDVENAATVVIASFIPTLLNILVTVAAT